jgi:hypothetical protein
MSHYLQYLYTNRSRSWLPTGGGDVNSFLPRVKPQHSGIDLSQFSKISTFSKVINARKSDGRISIATVLTFAPLQAITCNEARLRRRVTAEPDIASAVVAAIM